MGCQGQTNAKWIKICLGAKEGRNLDIGSSMSKSLRVVFVSSENLAISFVGDRTCP